jgi:hypothetical protein
LLLSWQSDILNFHFTPFNELIANYVCAIQRGEKAIAGEKERISTHRFPPENTDRVIYALDYGTA